MTRTVIRSPNAAAPIGPYSQAQVVRLHGGNRMVFTSGQIMIDFDIPNTAVTSPTDITGVPIDLSTKG